MKTSVMKRTLVALMACTALSLSAQEQKQYPEQEAMRPGMSEYWTPQPKIVTPGDAVTHSAPSDAIVLFDGKDWIDAVQRIACHRLLVFIILIDVGITHNQHFRIRSVNSQITIGYIESHIGECGVRIRELRGIKAHVGCTHHSSVGHGITIEYKVRCGV